MSYIGNSLTQQSFTGGMDQFNGNASNTTFGLSRSVTTPFDVNVFVESVYQRPGVAYTVSANTITFTSAPSTGANNIVVVYENFTAVSLVPAAGSVTPTAIAANTIQATLGYVPANKAGDTFSGTITANTLVTSTNTATFGTTVYHVANGNVGIGTSTPTSKLHLAGTSYFTSAHVIDSGYQDGLKVLRDYNVATGGPAGQSIQFGAKVGSTPTYPIEVNATTDTDGTAYNFNVLFNGNTALTINKSKTLILPGGQISFPATQIASSDGNTLDDYEEGTFTPRAGDGSSAMGQVFKATYTKIGNRVLIDLDVTFPNPNPGTNSYLTNLPFAGSTTTGNGGTGIGYYTGGTTTGIYAHVTGTTTSLPFYTYGGNQVNMSGVRLICSLVYQTS